MADKRINALTTTSASVGDDYFAIDGATNGTRALSAFSPTFGGNATVTGTLTVNGATLTSTGDISVAADKGIYLKQGNVHKWTSDGTSSGTSRADIYADSGGAFFIRTGGATQALTISSGQGATFAGAVATASTIASTSTSTGALVVGNGTSGGLGVGGSINAGGNVTISGSNGYAVIGGRQWSFRANSSGGSPASGCVIRDDSAAADRLTIDINGNTSVLSTTASTSTSSGALVVSGGVGVAGAIYGGGDIISSGNGNIQGGRFTSVNSNSYIEQSGTDFTYVTGGSRPHVFSIGGTTRFQVTTSGIISSLPASAASLTVNSTMTFELTSNTSLKIFVRGSDGTTRSTTLTLA